MQRRNLYDFPHETERNFVDLPVGMYDSTESFNFFPSRYGTLVVFKGLYKYGALLWFSSENKVYIRNFYVDASKYEFRGNWKELGGVISKLLSEVMTASGGWHDECDKEANECVRSNWHDIEWCYPFRTSSNNGREAILCSASLYGRIRYDLPILLYLSNAGIERIRLCLRKRYKWKTSTRWHQYSFCSCGLAGLEVA